MHDTKVVDGPKIRLMHCPTCGTVEELPYFDGPAERDTLFQVAVENNHSVPGGYHHIRVFDIVEKVWALPGYKQRIMEQIKGGSPGMAALDPSYYDTRDTFRESAMLCFRAHNRPDEGCGDYRSDRKMLVPNTGAERKELGLSKPGLGRSPVHWLCTFCPVEAYYTRKRRGD